MNSCERFVKILLSVTDKVYQDESNQEPDEYIVWSLIGDKSYRADNSEAECALRFNVRIFSKSSDISELPKLLKKAFNKNDIAYEDFVSQYDTEYKYTIYSTFCEVE